MPVRKVPLVRNHIYHVFNRGANKQPIFYTFKNYKRALHTIKYYLIHRPPLPYSKFIKLPDDLKEEFLDKTHKLEKCVEVIAYVLMPNHYHFLLRQIASGGIKDYVRNFQISYTRYLNKRHNRSGPLLEGQFKAVLIEDDEQLIHVSRYIHLNPYTSFVINDLQELENYQWSSLLEYLGEPKDEICMKDLVLSLFQDKKKYWEFCRNQADYQRKVDKIKHLMLE